MASDRLDVPAILKRTRTVFVSQLLLTALAIAAARLGLGGRAAMMTTLGIALVNAALVAWFVMGVGRERPVVVTTLVVMLIVSAGLLFWPAWGHYDSMRLP